MQISTNTGVVHAMLSSFDVPKEIVPKGRNSNTPRVDMRRLGAADRAHIAKRLYFFA
jgi:hypothetical protein